MADRASHLHKGDDPDLDAAIANGRFHADRYRRAIDRQAALDPTLEYHRHQAQAAQVSDAIHEIAAIATRIDWDTYQLLAVLDAANRLKSKWPDQPRQPTYAEIANELRMDAERIAQAHRAALARVAYATASARRLERESVASTAASAYFNDRRLADAA